MLIMDKKEKMAFGPLFLAEKTREPQTTHHLEGNLQP